MKALFQASHEPSRKALVLLRDLIAERTGNHYGDSSLQILGDKISGRAVELGLITFLDYYYLLRYDPLQEEEWPILESLITVKETYFWREPEAFRAVIKQAIPEIGRRRLGPVRIWHAGCAQGEEPLSLVMALEESGLFQSTPFDILATDIDRKALQTARLGLYKERAMRRLPPEQVARHFSLSPSGDYQIDPYLLSRVRFRQLNLAGPDSLLDLPQFDIIFCRNVMIYFNDELLTRTATHFHRLLDVPGYLFLGATESLLRYRVPLTFTDMKGVIGYRKEDARG